MMEFIYGYLMGVGIVVLIVVFKESLLKAMEKVKNLLPLLLCVLYMQACSSEPPPDPATVLSILENNRATGIANAQFNARRFAATVFPGFAPQTRVDSTIQAECPQGDGWASVDLVNDQNERVKIKCSTYSSTIECMSEQDFLKKEVFNSQEGHCNPDVPHPLPKLTN